MKNKKSNLIDPIKITGFFVFLIAFILNIQTSIDGQWELVNVGFGQSTADNEEPECSAGGCNATSCSFTGEVMVMGTGVQVSNAISCSDTWACCSVEAYCFSKDLCEDTGSGGSGGA